MAGLANRFGIGLQDLDHLYTDTRLDRRLFLKPGESTQLIRVLLPSKMGRRGGRERLGPKLSQASFSNDHQKGFNPYQARDSALKADGGSSWD